MIRPFRHETLRYGDYSRAEEFRYDHPFQWGSKRTGPDVHRVGGKYPNLWHYQHLMDPRSTSQGSNMPLYSFLKGKTVDFGKTRGKMITMRKLGVPYTDEEIASCVDMAQSQAQLIAADLGTNAVTIDPGSRMVALIAYLQRLGRGPQPITATRADALPARAPAGTSASTGATLTGESGATPAGASGTGPADASGTTPADASGTTPADASGTTPTEVGGPAGAVGNGVEAAGDPADNAAPTGSSEPAPDLGQLVGEGR
jgi:hypothetical protein